MRADTERANARRHEELREQARQSLRESEERRARASQKAQEPLWSPPPPPPSSEPSSSSSSSSGSQTTYAPSSSGSSGNGSSIGTVLLGGLFVVGVASVFSLGSTPKKAPAPRTQPAPITTPRPNPLPPLDDAFYVAVRGQNADLFTPINNVYPRPVKIGTTQRWSCFASAERLSGHRSPDAYIVVYLPTETGYRDLMNTVLINKNDLRALPDDTSSCRASFRTFPAPEVTPAARPATPKPAIVRPEPTPTPTPTRAAVIPQVAAAPKPVANVQPAQLTERFIVTASALNLRAEPSTQGRPIGTFAEGSCVTVTADATAGFVKVTTIDMNSRQVYISGFVSEDYLTRREGPDSYACRASFTPK